MDVIVTPSPLISTHLRVTISPHPGGNIAQVTVLLGGGGAQRTCDAKQDMQTQGHTPPPLRKHAESQQNDGNTGSCA